MQNKVHIITLLALVVLWTLVAAWGGYYIAKEPENVAFYSFVFGFIGIFLTTIVGGLGAVVWAILRTNQPDNPLSKLTTTR